MPTDSNEDLLPELHEGMTPEERADLLEKYLDGEERLRHLEKYGNDLLNYRPKIAPACMLWRTWDWSGCRFGGQGHLPVFEEGGDFSNLNLRGANFETGSFRWVEFCGADLRGASFRGARILESSFADANIDGATFLDAEIDDDTITSSGWTPTVLAAVHRSGATFRSLDRLPAQLSRAVVGGGPGLTLTLDTRLHRFDATAFDALIAEVLGPDTDVTIEERSNIDADGPGFIRINGARPDDLVVVAEAFYDRIWATRDAAEHAALQRTMTALEVLFGPRLTEMRDHLIKVEASTHLFANEELREAIADKAAEHVAAKRKKRFATRTQRLIAAVAAEAKKRTVDVLVGAAVADVIAEVAGEVVADARTTIDAAQVAALEQRLIDAGEADDERALGREEK